VNQVGFREQATFMAFAGIIFGAGLSDFWRLSSTIFLVNSDENHSQRGVNFHPVFIPLSQLYGAILDCGFWIAD
jgi:hypothetical protein